MKKARRDFGSGVGFAGAGVDLTGLAERRGMEDVVGFGGARGGNPGDGGGIEDLRALVGRPEDIDLLRVRVRPKVPVAFTGTCAAGMLTPNPITPPLPTGIPLPALPLRDCIAAGEAAFGLARTGGT